MVNRQIYIISPACSLPVFFDAEVMTAQGYRPALLTPNLALPTLAGCVPPDFKVTLCEERSGKVDLDHPAEHVWITCNSLQYERMRQLAKEFRGRGKTVMVGGPFATLTPEAVRPFCDVLFRGEFESAADEVFADLRAGKLKNEYHGAPADMERSPTPRWDLYPNDRAFGAALQASRGCPNNCNFCEVIHYYGRRPRLKSPDQVLRELDAVYEQGYRFAFFTDDNFSAVPKHAKKLLEAIAAWNQSRKDGRMQFITQVTMDASRDEELLALLARAGMVHVAVGIETPEKKSLEEAGKHQNLHGDMEERLRAFMAYGINVVAYMIIGFDADGPDIFEKHERFLSELSIPLAKIGPLVLTRGTPLYDKLHAENRLRWDGIEPGQPLATNIIPRQMTREELLRGIGDLCGRFFAPEAFAARLEGFVARRDRGEPAYPEGFGALTGPKLSAIADAEDMVERSLVNDPSMAKVREVLAASDRARPECSAFMRLITLLYLQMRFMFPGPRQRPAS